MPRAGLNRGLVVAEAADVADEVGLDRLTLAAVAQRFGVAVPSLYKHVAGLDALHRELALLGVRELTAAISQATVGRSGTAALHATADAYRGFATSFPGRYVASVRAPAPGDDEHDAASDAALAVVVAALSGYEISGADVVDVIRSLRAALHGFVTLEGGGGFGQPVSVDHSFRRLVGALDVAYRSWAETV